MTTYMVSSLSILPRPKEREGKVLGFEMDPGSVPRGTQDQLIWKDYQYPIPPRLRIKHTCTCAHTHMHVHIHVHA